MSDGLPPLPPHLDPRGKHRGHHGPGINWRSVRWVTQGLCAVLSAVLLVTFGIYWWEYRTLNGGLDRLSIFGSSLTKPSKDIDGKAQNILIVGNDDRSTATDAELAQLGTTRDGGSLNTDTMMIVHVPADGKAATLISLPRDSYVDIPGFGKDKLNAAYPDAYDAANGTLDAKRAAGAKLLVEVIQNLTGLTIDHFVQVDLLGFYRISNAIGPVNVNMCAAVKEPDSGIDLKKGINPIVGKQALAFVRQRYNFPNGLGDLDRVERQRYFLTAAFRKIESAGTLLNPGKLHNLLSAVVKSLYMDSTLDPIKLADQMLSLQANNIVGKTIPTDGFGMSTNGQSVVLVNPNEVQAFIIQFVGPTDPKLAGAKLVDPSTVSVTVTNAANIANDAAQNAAVLQQAGFKTSTGSAPTPQAVTVIEYPDGMQSQAKTVAKYVPGAVLQKVSKASGVTLVLGTDGKHAKIPVTPKPGTPTTKPTPGATPTPKAIDSGCIN